MAQDHDRPKKLTPEQKARILELAREGMPTVEIARFLRIHGARVNGVINTARLRGLLPPRNAIPANGAASYPRFSPAQPDAGAPPTGQTDAVPHETGSNGSARPPAPVPPPSPAGRRRTHGAFGIPGRRPQAMSLLTTELIEENGFLKGQIELVGREHRALSGRLEALLTENARLKIQLQFIDEERKELLARDRGLFETIARIQTENSMLRSEIVRITGSEPPLVKGEPLHSYKLPLNSSAAAAGESTAPPAAAGH